MDSIFSYQLRPTDLENQFRSAMLNQDKIFIRAIFFLFLGISILYAFLEFFYLKAGVPITIVNANRFIIIMLMMFFALWSIYRPISVRFFDWAVFLSTIFYVVHTLVGFLFRPVGYFVDLTTVVWHSLAILGIYTILPIHFHLQVISALLLTGGSYIIWLIAKAPIWSVIEAVIVFSTYFSVNCYGMYLSIRQHRLRRRQYVSLENERAVKEELEAAITEIKVLQGIIPICASCKQIRDDNGYWNQIETYIRRHSEAEFSHGICPECANKLYPICIMTDKSICDVNGDARASMIEGGTNEALALSGAVFL